MWLSWAKMSWKWEPQTLVSRALPMVYSEGDLSAEPGRQGGGRGDQLRAGAPPVLAEGAAGVVVVVVVVRRSRFEFRGGF